MTKKEYKALYQYLANNCGDVAKFFEKDQNNNFTGKFIKTADCKLRLINRAFGSNVTCSQYDAVANGEGNEEEKIDSIYSSSLQSLLVFYRVDNENKIVIGKESFNRVIFEYKNKVIGYPSSVDVVLLNDHAVAFIESKYLEIVRDSGKKGKKVVGISYYGKKENGYCKIDLNKDELDKMKISYPIWDNVNLPYIEDVSGKSKNKQLIEKLDDATFVYSEGIKQVLSHIIGINAFKNGDSAYSHSDPISNRDHFKKIIYVELYNEFPYLEFATDKIKDFKKHVNLVGKIIQEKKKEIVNEFLVMSYQDLYDANKEFFNFDNRVVNYFRLDRKHQK